MSWTAYGQIVLLILILYPIIVGIINTWKEKRW